MVTPLLQEAARGVNFVVFLFIRFSVITAYSQSLYSHRKTFGIHKLVRIYFNYILACRVVVVVVDRPWCWHLSISSQTILPLGGRSTRWTLLGAVALTATPFKTNRTIGLVKHFTATNPQDGVLASGQCQCTCHVVQRSTRGICSRAFGQTTINSVRGIIRTYSS
jgi:hypothetical protein